MGFYIFDHYEVGDKGKLERVEAIPGVISLPGKPSISRSRKEQTSYYAVCWVDSYTFEAVGIAFDDMELKRFITGMNGRPHRWFMVPVEELVKLKPHLAEYFRGERDWRA